MTRDEVELRMKQIGFELRREDPQDPYATIWLNNELIGDLTPAGIDVAIYLPSYVGKNWMAVERQRCGYGTIANANYFRNLKRDLLDTPRRYDEALRKARVKEVQKYFKYKQESHRLADLAWKTLYPGFKKARGE